MTNPFETAALYNKLGSTLGVMTASELTVLYERISVVHRHTEITN